MARASTVPTTRRALFGAAVAAPALVALAAAASPDSELITLGNRLSEIWAAEAEIDTDDPNQEGAYYARMQEVVDPILRARATTIEGMKAKAKAAAWALGESDVSAWLAVPERTTSELAAFSIVRDLLAG